MMSEVESPTYRAVQATAPGKLELVDLPLRKPAPGEVRIRVEACGVCHSDSGTVEGLFEIAWPRVPGHEAVGRIDALGADVAGWTVGQRVGVGFLGGSCGHCLPCRGGDLISCQNQEFTGIQHDGGYAERMIAKASGLIIVPEEFDAAEAAPLLCAGLTTFNALRDGGAKAGDIVAIIGIGGLGHLAVQFARKMGFEVVAIGRGSDKTQFAKQLGAHHYIDGAAENVSDALQKLGGASLIVSTAPTGAAASSAVGGLRPRGKLVAVGVASDPVQASTMDLIFASRTILGTLTGTPATGDATLKFSALAGVRPMIETLPLEKASEGYAKMMSGAAHFRIVLVMDPVAAG